MTVAAGDSARQSADDNDKEGRRLLALSRRRVVGADGEGLVAAALEPLTGLGWTLLEDRRWSPGSDANIDLIAVGPGGIVVIDAKNWHTAPKVTDDALRHGEVDCSDQVDTALAAARRVEESVAALRIAPAAVTVMMAFARHRIRAQVGRVTVVGAHAAAAHIAGLPIRFTPAHARRAVAHLDIAFPAHTSPPIEPMPGGHSDGAEPLTLFDVHEMLAAQARSARLGPIEEWMTWISPAQHDLVRRDFGGPARISGVAGTGKTVVGLHRAAHLAGHGQGPVLFVTFVKNLVNLQRSLLARLAPNLVRRVEFKTVHGLAISLLSRHGPVSRINTEGLDRCFDDAWLSVGRPLLSQLDQRPGYWRDEILYVIKGRGFRALADYIGPERHGRRMPLQDRHREAVWQLYADYERLRRERGLYDFADMLLLAVESLRREPLDDKYAAVIVDEAQDLTLTALRLVHGLVKDKPNGLLLIGDAQQAVYPGGYRLADAGIQIRGRSVVLRVNYRNRSAILAAAAEIVSASTLTDIDGGRWPAMTTWSRPATTARSPGSSSPRKRNWTTPWWQRSQRWMSRPPPRCCARTTPPQTISPGSCAMPGCPPSTSSSTTESPPPRSRSVPSQGARA
jgi:hypothetical protein